MASDSSHKTTKLAKNVLRDTKMKKINDFDIGESDVMNSEPPMMPAHVSRAHYGPQHTQDSYRNTNSETNQDQDHPIGSNEVTDLSESSAGTEGSKNQNYGSPPISIPLENSNYNDISAPSVDTSHNLNQGHNQEIGNRSELWWSQHRPRKRENVLRRLSETLVRGSLTKIDISQCDLNSSDAHIIRLALLRNSNLSILKLGYNNFGDEGIAVIASAIQGHRSLSVLDAGFNNIGDEGCSSIAKYAVAKNLVLHTLYLSGNSVGENGALALSQAIIDDQNGRGCGLRCLHLTANCIKGNGVKALTRAIAMHESRRQEIFAVNSGHFSHAEDKQIQHESNNRIHNEMNSSQPKFQDYKLDELYLAGTDMGAVGCLSVSNMMLTNYSLRVLSLSHNGITDKDLTLFSQSLSRNKLVPIEVLQLSFNHLTCVGVESLMNVVWGSKTLRDIRLDNNKIRDRGAQLVAVVLTSVDLEKVDLGFNKITTVGIKALMKSLAENESLRSLTLSGNTLDTSASKAVSYALAYNTNLNSLYMDNCSVGYAAQRHVAAGVASNSCSSLRTLTGFRIGAIAVTLGLPTSLETWANDQVLGFFHLMWKRWKKETASEGSNEHLQSGSSMSLPNKNSNKLGHSSSQMSSSERAESTSSLGSSMQRVSVKKNGPMNPNTVVSVAKSTYDNLVKDSNSLQHLYNNHREVSLQCPLAPNDEMILETTSTGITRIPPVDDFSSNIQILGNPSMGEKMKTGKIQKFVYENNAEVGIGMQIDSKRKDKLTKWLQKHANYLNEVSQQSFDNGDMWKLHQHFFSPVNASEYSLGNQTNGRENFLKKPYSDMQSTPFKKYEPVGININVSDKDSNSPRSLTQTIPQSFQIKSLERKTSYRSLNAAMYTTPTDSMNSRNESQRQPSPATRPWSEIDDSSFPSMQPAQKRAKKARISYFPRVKTRLEMLRSKTSEHQALILMRQLKYIESALLYENDSHSDGEGFTSADVESILMDML